MREIDLTKVKLDPRSIVTLIFGFLIVAIVIGIAIWSKNRIAGLFGARAPTTGATTGQWG